MSLTRSLEPMTPPTESINNTIPEPNFNGAAIIDESGKEIPITESMIRAAIEQLDRCWQPAPRS